MVCRRVMVLIKGPVVAARVTFKIVHRDKGRVAVSARNRLLRCQLTKIESAAIAIVRLHTVCRCLTLARLSSIAGGMTALTPIL